MKNKFLVMLLSTICILVLAACGGDVSNVKVTAYQSQIYTDNEIQSAIKATETYFKKHFSGCTLTEITYAGDDKTISHIEWAKRNDADEVIVLTSSFDVDASGGDGSLNPNSTYSRWMWILVRNKGSKWKHVDHGY